MTFGSCRTAATSGIGSMPDLIVLTTARPRTIAGHLTKNVGGLPCRGPASYHCLPNRERGWLARCDLPLGRARWCARGNRGAELHRLCTHALGCWRRAGQGRSALVGAPHLQSNTGINALMLGARAATRAARPVLGPAANFTPTKQSAEVSNLRIGGSKPYRGLPYWRILR